MDDLRQQFFDIMCELAEKDKTIRVLVGDLGYSFFEKFRDRFPEQFINCGIAEQNMVGVAVGMAIMGLKPYVYSNALFLLSRANEFVRDDVAYNNLDVKLCGTGAAGFLGFSHNLLMETEEDFIKRFPNILSCRPKDKNGLKIALKLNGPMFIKL